MLKVCWVFWKLEPHYAYKRYGYMKHVVCCYLVGSMSRHQVSKEVLRTDTGRTTNLINIFHLDVNCICKLASCKSHSSGPFPLQFYIRMAWWTYCKVSNILTKFLHTPSLFKNQQFLSEAHWSSFLSENKCRLFLICSKLLRFLEKLPLSNHFWDTN